MLLNKVLHTRNIFRKVVCFFKVSKRVTSEIMAVRPLAKEFQDKAIIELNEVPNRVQEDIKHIQEWCSKQPHLKIRNDDQWLLSFLRACKFSLQRTKEKLDLYYTSRSLSPEFFHNINQLTPGIYACLTQGMPAVLPDTPDLLSPRRCFARFVNADPEIITAKDILSVGLMFFDISIYNDDPFVINGQEVIIDLQDIDYAYAAQITPTLIKKSVTLFLNAYPTRLKGVYVLNLPPFLQFAVNIALSFLSEKLRKRVHLYSKDNIEDLYGRIPRTVLPEEYGGHAGPYSELSDKFRAFMENKRDWLLENSKYFCDEAKRPEKTKHFLGFSDVEGSFRKLEID